MIILKESLIAMVILKWLFIVMLSIHEKFPIWSYDPYSPHVVHGGQSHAIEKPMQVT